MKTLVNHNRLRGALAPAVTAALLMAAVGAAAAAATRPVNEQGRMPADGQVTVENIAGSVKVVAWDQAEIKVTGTLGEDVKELTFSAGARSVVKVVYPERRGLHFNGLNHKDKDKDKDKVGMSIHDDAGADLTISVPRGCRLDIEVVSADVDVAGLTNEVSVTAVSGAVTVRGACASLEVECVSGDVEVDGAGKQTEVTTVSGNLNVRCDDAELQVETVTGDATVDCSSLRSLEANTVNGTITMSGRPAAGASIEAESVNGNLTLIVPADVSASFEVSTFNGDIENAFGQKAERTDKYVPGQNLKFTNGNGDADVSLNTLNGKVVIRKK